MAALAIDEQADRYAYRQGLFVLTMGREGLAHLRANSWKHQAIKGLA